MKIIDADKLHYKQVYIQTEKGLRPALVVFAKEIRKMPEIPQLKVKVDPVRPGEWIYGEHDMAMCDGYWCDQCGFFVPWDYEHKFIDFIKDYHWCPHCGARMGVEDETD